MKMNKFDKIAEFLDHRRNKLFSALKGGGIPLWVRICAAALTVGLFAFLTVRYVDPERYQNGIKLKFNDQHDYQDFVCENDYTVPDGADVVFIGNSLTGRGGLADFFGQMVEDRNITVTELYVNGITLAEMYDIIKEKQEWRDIVESAECIILQDYGGKSDPEAVKNILNLDAELEHAYFFMTDFCVDENDDGLHIRQEYIDISEKSGYEVTPVGWGYISMQMCDKFGSEYFYYEDGYHPTGLNGAVTAMLFYCFLTGERCEGVNYELPQRLYTFFSEGELETLLGEAETEVSDFYFEVMGKAEK